MSDQTIAAIATGVGGTIAIIRISGADALELAEACWEGRQPLAAYPPRTLALGRITEGGRTEDRAMAVYMPGPHSYTGEDVVEFHCHGGALVARTVLALLLRQGARHAEPGEFTRRAFINGKLDLTQAEAVLDVIEAQSEMALHAANRQLAGELGRRVDTLYESLTQLLGEIEVRMDFTDEDLDWQTSQQLRAQLDAGISAVEDLLRYRAEGEILRQGVRLVLAGAPNAGKSSLLNLMLGRDRAIVTDIPGTTRDTLEELAHVRGIPIQLVDTAGIREAVDAVEQQGVARSLSSIDQAQLVIWVVDVTRSLADQQLPTERLRGKGQIVVANKMDLVPGDFLLDLPGDPCIVHLSARTGDGLETLFDTIEQMVWGHPHTEEPEVAINARHSNHLETAIVQLKQGREVAMQEDFDLLAINLRATLDALGHITGKTVQPDILDTIFSKFCIGK